VLPGSTWDPSPQTHIGPFDPEVQIKSQWISLQTFDPKKIKIFIVYV
jgi:hypothetical protein